MEGKGRRRGERKVSQRNQSHLPFKGQIQSRSRGRGLIEKKKQMEVLNNAKAKRGQHVNLWMLGFHAAAREKKGAVGVTSAFILYDLSR